MEINDELLRDLTVEMLTKLDYESLCELLELCDEEITLRERQAFEKYTKECENRHYEQDGFCPKCPAYLECKAIRDYEDIAGEPYEALLEEVDEKALEGEQEIKDFIASLVADRKDEENIVLRIKVPISLGE